MILTLKFQIKMICIESYKLNYWKGKVNNAKLMLLINLENLAWIKYSPNFYIFVEYWILRNAGVKIIDIVK